MYSLYTLKSNNGAFTNSWTNNVHYLLRELGLPYTRTYKPWISFIGPCLI